MSFDYVGFLAMKAKISEVVNGFQKMLSEGKVEEVVVLLAMMYGVDSPKVIVSEEEYRKYDQKLEGGYFRAPDTLIFHPRAAGCLGIVRHEFEHYVHRLLFGILPADHITLEGVRVLKKRSEELVIKSGEILAILY